MDYEIAFLKALVITILTETTVLFLLVKLVFKEIRLNTRNIILAGIIASFATLPYLWFIIPVWVKSKLYYIILSETLAVVFESFVLFGILRIKYAYAFIFSAICNLISYLVGLLIF